MITVDLARLPVTPGDRILDIGCGSGRHSAAAYRLAGVHVTGADIELEDLGKARDRLQFHDRWENTAGAHGSVRRRHQPPAVPGRLLRSGHLLRGIGAYSRSEAAVHEIVRVLKPGKPLVVSVPRYFPERICWALSDDYASASQGHVRIYRKQELIELLERAGTRLDGAPLCPQPPHPLLVAQVPAGPHPNRCVGGQPLPPPAGLGHHAKTVGDPLGGPAAQPAVGQKPGRVYD